MTITTAWDNDEKTILRYQFSENWTWDEFFAARNPAYILLDSVPHKVAVIMDGSRIQALPLDMIGNVRAALGSKHPKAKVIIIVITNPLLHTLVNMLKTISPLGSPPLEVVTDLDDARQLATSRLDRVLREG